MVSDTELGELVIDRWLELSDYTRLSELALDRLILSRLAVDDLEETDVGALRAVSGGTRAVFFEAFVRWGGSGAYLAVGND